MKLIFGFDLGTTSIGSAVIRYDANRDAGEILHLGTRIFPEARDSEGTPLNQQRRLARTMRRQVRRRRERRKLLNETLAEAGLLPRFNSAEWSHVMALDPYTLRKEGLERALTPAELGRALYHLSKRRHFRQKDLEEGDDATVIINKNEAKKEKEATNARQRLVTALKENETTLGAYLAGIDNDQRKRGHHAERKNVIDEFNRLIAAQKVHHMPLLDKSLVDRIEDTIFAQKPVFWRKKTLGRCHFFPDLEPSQKASWLSCQRRMLEKLNNLEISGGNRHPLDTEERQAILDQLQTKHKMSWSKIRDALKPLYKVRGISEKALRFNLEEGGSKHIEGNHVEAELAETFSASWANHPYKDAIRKATSERLRNADFGEIGEQRVIILQEKHRKARRKTQAATFARDFGATGEQVAKLEELSFPNGWEAYSTKALEILLPELEKGIKLGTLLASADYHDWRNAHFPNRERPTGEILDRLPSPRSRKNLSQAAQDHALEETIRLRSIRNPTVIRVQNELRKVVNNLISAHGKPDLIRIEMTRDIGLSKAEREKKKDRMEANQEKRAKVIESLKAKGIKETNDNIEKWLLWKECGEIDPYSGDPIDLGELFSSNDFEVEHIWPLSISLDNSFGNKTLCRRDLNQLKSKRLPFEAFGHLEPQWNEIKLRVEKMSDPKKGSGMSSRKAKRFLASAIPEDFTSRQLNDTGYAARQSIAFLKRLWPDVGPEGKVNVQPVNGKVTAHLRKLWDLNNILSDNGEKTRADHRHHAIDALVVACTDPGVTQKLSRYWQLKDSLAISAQEPRLDPPWATIQQEADRAVQAIIVSHRVRKKVSGPLHSGSVYGDTQREITVGNIDYRVVVERVPISSLLLADLLSDNLERNRYKIADEGVRKAIEIYLVRNGIDVENYKNLKKIKASEPDLKILKRILANAIPFGDKGTMIRKVRVLTKKQLHLMMPVHNGLTPTASNHHFALYQGFDGKLTELPVSLNTALVRNKRGEPIIKKELEDGSKLLFSISKGDIIEFDDERARYWVVRMLASSGQILIVPNNEARRDKDKDAIKFTPSLKNLVEKNVKKISVDPIGRIRPAHD